MARPRQEVRTSVTFSRTRKEFRNKVCWSLTTEEGETETDDLTEEVRASWYNELQASGKGLDLKSAG